MFLCGYCGRPSDKVVIGSQVRRVFRKVKLAVSIEFRSGFVSIPFYLSHLLGLVVAAYRVEWQPFQPG